MTPEESFRYLVHRFIDDKSYFSVEFNSDDNFDSCFAESNKIILWIFSPWRGEPVPDYYYGKIFADHADCFNKVRDCPMNDYLPSTEKEVEQLFKNLEWLGSNEGKEWSKKYNCYKDKRLPRVITI